NGLVLPMRSHSRNQDQPSAGARVAKFQPVPASAVARPVVGRARRTERYKGKFGRQGKEERTGRRSVCVACGKGQQRPFSGGAPFPLKARAILLEQLALCRIVHQDQTLRRVQSGYNHVMEISASAGLEGNDQGTSFLQMLG